MIPVLDPAAATKAIRSAIQSVREEPLHDWVVVAVWDQAGGDVEVYGQSDPLELKGYLHSGIWSAAHGHAIALPKIEMEAATDVRSFPKGQVEVVHLGTSTVGRGTFHPGWRWSECVSPIVEADMCQLPHIGYVISGRMMILPRDGDAYEICAGDAVHIAPGHDAWTVGDEDCVVLEILSAERNGRAAAREPVVTNR